jgi:hypothetical protein
MRMIYWLKVHTGRRHRTASFCTRKHHNLAAPAGGDWNLYDCQNGQYGAFEGMKSGQPALLGTSASLILMHQTST